MKHIRLANNAPAEELTPLCDRSSVIIIQMIFEFIKNEQQVRAVIAFIKQNSTAINLIKQYMFIVWLKHDAHYMFI